MGKNLNGICPVVYTYTKMKRKLSNNAITKLSNAMISQNLTVLITNALVTKKERKRTKYCCNWSIFEKTGATGAF